ncbi:LOW QUALITY PROTEIN: Hypothetical protein PHPALM_12681, partial [Phytophthora palmivora]
MLMVGASTKKSAAEATAGLTRVFSKEELNELTEGGKNGVLEEKEGYDKELEERLFPLDEVELKKRMEVNASQSQKMSLVDLSTVLGIPEEVISRTRESSPGVLSTPEYWTAWYRKTLAVTGAAKRANRDFSDLRKSDGGNYSHNPERVTDSDERDVGGGGIFESISTEYQAGASEELPSYSYDEEAVIANLAIDLSETSDSAVDAVTVSSRQRKRLDPKWRALVQRMVYYVVKEEEKSNPGCVDCGSPLLSELVLREVDPKVNNLEERALAKVAQYYRAMSNSVMNRIVGVIVEKYLSEGPLIRAKLKEREDRCDDCLKTALPSRKTRSPKQVRFDYSSLTGQKTEELGPRCSREDSNSVYEYAYVVTDPVRVAPARRVGDSLKTGLVERDMLDESEVTNVVPEGKRVIGSVGGVDATSPGYVDCVPVDILIDSGAVVSLIDRKLLRRIGRANDSLRPYDGNLNGVSGHQLKIRGVADLPLRLGSVEIVRPFVVVEHMYVDVILGTDSLRQFRAVVDLDTSTVTLKDTGEVFSLGTPRVEEAYSARVSSTIRICPGGQALVVSEVRGQASNGQTVLVEGTVRVARILCTVNRGKLLVEVCNASSEELIIKKDTLVAAATVVPESAFEFESQATPLLSSDSRPTESTRTADEDWVHSVESSAGATMDSSRHSMPNLKRELADAFAVDFTDSKLSEEQRRLFRQTLGSFRDLFVETSMKPGRTHLLEHWRSPPIKQRPYRVSKAEGDVMEAEVQPYLDLGLIQPSSSPWASPVLMIRKPDGGIRFCIDYRRLNAVTVKDCYPMPLIDDTLDVLGNAKLFSTMDIASGYWNVPMAAGSVGKTAFACKFGLFEWLVLPFGLCNAVPAFERLMEGVLVGLKWRTCLVYLDDCVVFSDDFPTHLVRPRQVLERFRTGGFKLKMKKCKWGRDQVAFLGHIVTPSGILPNPQKVKAVMNVERPSDLRAVRAFLGLTSYFRRYIPGYAAISAPIEGLKAKGVHFEWSPDCESAFVQLKRKLVESPILVYPNFNKRFKLYVDASKLAVGACLMQEVAGRDRAIAYASKLLVGSEKNWINNQDGTSEIECWGIVWATRKFRCYLDRCEFDLYTDHKALLWCIAGLVLLWVTLMDSLVTVNAVAMADLLNEANEEEPTSVL